MTVAQLEPPRTRSLVWAPMKSPRPLTEGPLLVRTRGMSRWHRPRSGRVYERGEGTVDVCYQCWCGQGVSSGRKTSNGGPPGFITADSLDDGVPLCGTCEGRAVGAGHPGIGVVVSAPAGLLFMPDRLTPPKVCPGVRARLFDAVDQARRIGWCLACRQLVAIRGYSNAGGDRDVLQKHEPGSSLVAGCPFHGWNALVRDGNTARCGCQVEEVPA